VLPQAALQRDRIQVEQLTMLLIAQRHMLKSKATSVVCDDLGRNCFASLFEPHELAMIVAEPITELIKLYFLDVPDTTLS